MSEKIIDVSNDRVVKGAKKDRVILSAAEVVGLLDLVIDNPRLDNGQRTALQGFGADFYREHWDKGLNFSIRQGVAGVYDLIGWHWKRTADHSNDLGHISEGLSKIPDTGLVIIDERGFINGSVPRALQYGLGIDGRERVEQVLERLNSGNKIAFMTVGGELPPTIAEPLHTLIDRSGGAASSVIGDFEADKPIEEILRRFKPEDHQLIRTAYRQLNIGTKKLVHFKFLGSQHDDNTGELEKNINDALDLYVDRPYAVWRYKDGAYRGDYNFAKCAFGLSLLVAVGLSLTGLESSGSPFLEGIKRVTPTLIADLSMNSAAAMSFVEEDRSWSRRASRLNEVLWSRYRYPIVAGVIGGLVLGESSEYLYQYLNGDYLNIPPAVMLGLAAIIPTYLTTRVTEYGYQGAGGENEISSHPVQNTMMNASRLGALATILLGPSGLYNNAIALTLATEALEPLFMMGLARHNFSCYEQEYLAKLSGNPIATFRDTVANYR